MSNITGYTILFIGFLPLTVATVNGAIRVKTFQLGLSAVFLVCICIILAYKAAKRKRVR